MTNILFYLLSLYIYLIGSSYSLISFNKYTSTNLNRVYNSLSNTNQDVITTSSLPSHIAYIIDGNGRWGIQQGYDRSYGHQIGANKTVEIVKATFELGIDTITLYLFSTENWKRPNHEIDIIFKLLEQYLLQYNEYFQKNNILLYVIGQQNRLNTNMQRLIEQYNIRSKQYMNEKKMKYKTLCLAISYGGRDDIVNTCKDIIKDKLLIDDINEDIFHSYTSTGKLGISSPDLIIRSSGEFRLSNFLLWQVAYSEFQSVDCLCLFILINL